MKFISDQNERLDKFLAAHHVKFSRTQIQEFIRNGNVKVNGRVVTKPALRVKKGDQVLISKEKNTSSGKEFIIEPEPDIPLEILYEDKDVAVINKQPRLIVHPTHRQRRHTLVNALVARYPEIIGVGENPLRPGIVHRLDKDTSGIMAIAKNQNTFFYLKNQFLKREVVKKYFALVEGIPENKEGRINYQIRPSKKNRLKKVAMRKLDVTGRKSVRTAETLYWFQESIDGFSLLEIQPKTGRTHQIRVHLSAIGHPIVGDRLYGAKKEIAARQMLHAYFLEFNLPSGKRLKLKTDLPEDMKILLNK